MILQHLHVKQVKTTVAKTLQKSSFFYMFYIHVI